jgi:hypothetical protein
MLVPFTRKRDADEAFVRRQRNSSEADSERNSPRA